MTDDVLLALHRLAAPFGAGLKPALAEALRRSEAADPDQGGVRPAAVVLPFPAAARRGLHG